MGRLNNKREVKIGIEAVTRCGGSCAGCVLTDAERSEKVAWDATTWVNARQYLRRYWLDQLDQHGQIDELALNFGQGDYMLLGDRDAEAVVEWASDTFDGQAAAFITTSAICNEARFARALERYSRRSKLLGQSLMIDLVFDPKLAASGWLDRRYAANINAITDIFGYCDFNINLSSEVVQAIGPDEMDAFVREHRIKRLTVNLVPTLSGREAWGMAWPAMMKWIRGLYRIWHPVTSGYDLNYGVVLSRAIQIHADMDMGACSIIDGVAEMLCREIYVDSHGAIYHTQAGIGDVQMSGRTGFVSHGSIHDHPFDSTALKRSATQISAGLYGEQLKNPSCAACRYIGVCTSAAVVPYRNVLGRLNAEVDRVAGEQCPVLMLPLLEEIEAKMRDGVDDGSGDCYRAKAPLVQKGLRWTTLPAYEKPADEYKWITP